MRMQGEHGAGAAEAAVREELALTERCLQKNPKSYAAWHQRRWLVGLGVVPSLERELALVTKCARSAAAVRSDAVSVCCHRRAPAIPHGRTIPTCWQCKRFADASNL